MNQRMTERERFLAVARFQKPDYVPLFGFPGAPGMSGGAMKYTHDRLVETGMPAHVGGCWVNWQCQDAESWHRYWGVTEPISPSFGLSWGAPGCKTTTRLEGEYEVIESEDGSITRQVINNDITYSMPEFVRYAVRDWESWLFLKDRLTPRQFMPRDEMEARCKELDRRDKPLCVYAGGAYAHLRGGMGPQAISLALYDSPELVHDMMAWQLERFRRDSAPLIERLKPEIAVMGEDVCYNHGMLLSPKLFDEFCGAYYREVRDCCRAAGVPVIAVDTDGNAMEFTGLAASYGVNCIYPYEVKAGNDLFALRQEHPRFLLVGWLEKEVVNEGNEHLIEPEIMGKVPALLAKGGYFPNGDHGIQPWVTFRGLCRFMTILHEVCGNPEGEFPRV